MSVFLKAIVVSIAKGIFSFSSLIELILKDFLITLQIIKRISSLPLLPHFFIRKIVNKANLLNDGLNLQKNREEA